MARHGLPPDSPLRQGLTLLFYKPQSRANASDPSQYRPITLLPMVIRVSRKLLDLLFRGGPDDRDADPTEAPAFPHAPLGFPRRPVRLPAPPMNRLSYSISSRPTCATITRPLYAAFQGI